MQIETELATTFGHPAQHITASPDTSKSGEADPITKSHGQNEVEIRVYELASQRAADDVVADMDTVDEVQAIFQSAGVTNLNVTSVSTSVVGTGSSGTTTCTSGTLTVGGSTVSHDSMPHGGDLLIQVCGCAPHTSDTVLASYCTRLCTHTHVALFVRSLHLIPLS